MKIRSFALVALAAACGQAFALSPAQVADSGTVKIYMSGASASRAIIGGLFTEHCTAADLDVAYSAIGSFGGAAFSANGDAHRVYSCTMLASSPILPGKKVALFKSDVGGSGQGVFPVHARSARGFLNLATCGSRAASVPNYVCSGEQPQVPMAGMSDVEPGLFRGINVPKDDPTYPGDGLNDTQIGELEVNPLFQTIFAVAVNKALRDAMQAAQGLTVGDAGPEPTISRTTASSYFAGVLTDPTAGLGWQPIVSAGDAKKATRVNICRRVDGSGTQASANAQFLQFPCNGAALTVADKSYSDAGLSNVVASVGTSGKAFVFEGSSTGNVISCLNQAETNGAYAIGHVSKENVPATSGTIGNWRHVKLDGVSANRDNTKSGQYDYFFESTLQWNKTLFSGLSSDQQGFLTAFAAQAKLPVSLAKLSSATQNGVAALPDTYAGAFGTGSANEITFGSRVTRGGNSCTPATFAK